MPENIAANNQLLLSNEVQEIISSRPNWIVRNGMVLFVCVIAVMIAVTWFVQYPDIVSTTAKLTSINSPKEMKTKTDGKLIKLMAVEGAGVKEGQILGLIESRANHSEVLELSALIDSMQSFLQNDRTEYINDLGEYLQLGEIQPAYQTFIQSLIIFRQYLGQGYYLKKKNMLLGDINYLQKLHTYLLQQKGIEQEDVALADTNFRMHKRLKDELVIAGLEHRNERSKYLNKRMTIPQIDATITGNESNQHEKQKEIMQLENEIAQQKGIFAQALNTLKAQLDDWKSKYVLIAPVDGKVAFAGLLQENQQLKLGQSICYINPGNSSYYAEMIIPQYNFGKVAVGQKVLLKFPAYPYQEFGTVYGNIGSISRIPTDSGYLAKVLLPTGLATNYKKEIQFRDGLLANGEIITKDMRLLQRFMYQLTAAFKRK